MKERTKIAKKVELKSERMQFKSALVTLPKNKVKEKQVSTFLEKSVLYSPFWELVQSNSSNI